MNKLVVYAGKLCVIVEFNEDLARLALRLGAHSDSGPEMSFQFLERSARIGVKVGGRALRGVSATGFANEEALELTNRQPAARDAMCELLAFVEIGDADECARMAGAELAVFHLVENRLFQSQDADRVCNRRAIFAGALGNFFLRHVEFIQQAVKSTRFFNGIEILALKVFYECQFQDLFVGNIAQDRRNALQSGALSGTPSAFAGDDLKARTHFSQYDGLDNSAGLNRARKFFERFFAETRAGLVRVRINQVDVDLIRARLRLCDRDRLLCLCYW